MDGLPGGPVAKRALHMFLLCDCSGSMRGEKIDSLNRSVRDSLGPTKEVAAKNANAALFLSVIGFGRKVDWLSEHVRIQDFRWKDLEAEQGAPTPLGAALTNLAMHLQVPPLPPRGLRPVVILISDGMPTDDWESGVQRILDQKWGNMAVRLAIAIGKDAQHEVLRRFIRDESIPVLTARNPEMLARHIVWASTSAVRESSASRTREERPFSDPPAGGESIGPEIW
ncbi:MAG: hypothetical protein U0Q16_25760 [Bryobacteraceae bacterium]